MRKRFTHPIAIGGYGTIIVTLVIFFAQGGFGKMTLLTTLYIIGLIIGVGLILYSAFKSIPNENTSGIKPELGLQDITPTLQKMHVRLSELCSNEAQKYFNIKSWVNFNRKINELIGVMPQKVNSEEEAKQEISRMASIIGENIKGKYILDMLPDMLEKSACLDYYGWGLKERRKKDRQYKNLSKNLQILRNKIADDDLNQMIRNHVELSESANNLFLAKERSLRVFATVGSKIYNVSDLMSPKITIGIESGDHKTDEFLNSIRIAINKRIKELEYRGEL